MKIIGFAGLSESGKSYSGKYLEKKFNIPRVKLVKIIDELRIKYMKDEVDLEQFHKFLYNPNNLFTQFFLDKLMLELETRYQGSPLIVVESLRNPFLGEHFKAKLGNDFIIVYFEAAFLTRVSREADKLNKESTDIINSTYKKDQEKIIHGALKYEKLCDYYYNNDSSLERLNAFLDKLVEASNQ
ncbi:hypothetical protein FZX01_03705 [Listeria monocytogenes]|uniref:hypothetical protein n=1 Tax=Listeria monocytogenes TaxID=1639 RepID=UPI0011EAB3D9|nr:hypothetical protein [Listeria monocytogenes]TYU88627.1 hypothetical protein FZX01_03705 [Listeria monocytogenes]